MSAGEEPANAKGPRPRVSGAIGAILSRNRDALNRRFAAVQRAGRRVDPEGMLEHLAGPVQAAIAAVLQETPEQVDATLAALYDVSLELFAASLLGAEARHPAVGAAWRRLLPAVPHLVAREPQRVAAAVSNAAHNLATTPGARPDAWIDLMVQGAPACTAVSDFLEHGKVAAWLAGMAHYRKGALAAARALPAMLAASALGLSADAPAERVAAAIDRLEADPWSAPAEALSGVVRGDIRLVAHAGAFRGFGGPFLRPPRVSYVGDGQFQVTDGEAAFRLLADAHGAVFVRAEPAAAVPVPGGAALRVARDGMIDWGPASARFPGLADPTSLATDGRTLAVTLATSHHVFLVAGPSTLLPDPSGLFGAPCPTA